jgi:hypothetical protein
MRWAHFASSRRRLISGLANEVVIERPDGAWSTGGLGSSMACGMLIDGLER